MKFDKEMMAKNQFWFGLGGFVVLWLIAILVTLLAVGSDEPRKAWEKAKTDLAAASRSPKTAKWQEPWNAHGQKFRSKKDDAWARAWKVQEGMYTWPEEMARQFELLYPDDVWAPDAPTDLNRRTLYRDSWYGNQFGTPSEGLEPMVSPVLFEGGFERVFPKQVWDPRRAPTREECWLAQEDFWVRREMLAIIREALDSVARFDPIPTDPKEPPPAAPVLGRTRWRNAEWELDLLIEKEPKSGRKQISAKSKIKNVSQNPLALASPDGSRGIFFNLYQSVKQPDGKVTTFGKPYAMEVAGEPLAPGRETEFKRALPVDVIDPTRPFSVFQVFTWETCPIRRIDRLELAVQSHRTSLTPLKIREDLKQLDPPRQIRSPGLLESPPGRREHLVRRGPCRGPAARAFPPGPEPRPSLGLDPVRELPTRTP